MTAPRRAEPDQAPRLSVVSARPDEAPPVSHRQPDQPRPRGPRERAFAPEDAQLVARFATTVLWLTRGTSALTGIALIVAAPGTSPAMLFLRSVLPLPGWGILLLVGVAGLGAAGLYAPANAVAVVVWLFLASGALLGLFNGSTSSPLASMVLAILVATVAVFHAAALWLRRSIARARPPGR